MHGLHWQSTLPYTCYWACVCMPTSVGCHAGKAHDVMALKCRGADSPLNFAMDEYAELLPMLAKLSKARLRPVCNTAA